MNLLNPFDKKDREESTFVDRTAITANWLLVIALTIPTPVLVIRWYKGANQKSRGIFWLALAVMTICGWILDEILF